MATFNCCVVQRAWECGILAQREPEIYLHPTVRHAIAALNVIEKRPDGVDLEHLTSQLDKAYNTNAMLLQCLDRLGAIAVEHRSSNGAPNVYHLLKRKP